MIEVACTGIGVVSAFGIGTDAFWQGLVEGRSGLRPISRFPAPEGALAGEVPPIDIRTFAHTALARRIDRASLLALVACRLALDDAGVTAGSVPAERIGMSLGSAFGNFGETATFLDRLFTRGAGNPLVFPNLVMNAPLSYASIELGVTGPTAFLTEQEASGEAAIAWGGTLVAEGRADLCFAGATDELDAVLHAVLREAGTLARREPRPYDPAADGSCPGEGAAVLVLEPMTRARARGARIYARLVPHPGVSVAAPVHGWPRDPDDVATGLAPLVADADLVVGSANGRPVLDRLEATALARACGGHRPVVTAPRAALGDFGAAGALGAAVAALAIAHGIVPPTRGIRAGADPSVSPLHTARALPVRAAVVNGLARGGACRPLRLEQP